MASTQQIRGRIRSVRNTRQITRAMQMVSASKLHRMQAAAQATQAYSKYARELLASLRQQTDVEENVFYKQRTVKRRLLIVITSDRGLAGAYNANVLKRYFAELKQDRTAGIETVTICFGRQGASAISRIKDANVLGIYTNLPDEPTMVDLQAAISTAIDQFLEDEIDAVDVLYTQFVNTIKQDVAQKRVLPAGVGDEPVSEDVRNAAFEPSIEMVLTNTTARLIEAQLLQMMLESNVSEQAMRMIAMKNATDNASDLIDAYTLEYNNARQAAITQELAEISGGVEAMKD